MPLKVFTLYNSNINRLRAEEDTRLLSILCSANSGESAKNVLDRLREDLGQPTISEAIMEEGAIERLKKLSETINNGN
jgi:hypothetical protein